MGRFLNTFVAFGVLTAAPSMKPVVQPTPVPRFSHILVIVIENKEFREVIGAAKMPNLNGWARQYALLKEYYAVTHPSLPNYLAMIGGDYFGIQEDCLDCFVRARNLADLLEAAGRTWKTYQEALPEPGFIGASSGTYVMRHNPFVYFESVRSDPARLQRSVVPLSQLTQDLEQASLPDFAFIVPDLCNSAHDCGPEVADAWLGRVVGSILGSPSFDGTSLLVITFDEGATDKSGPGSNKPAGGGRVATVLISPLVKPAYEDKTPYSHYSLLKTIAAAWGLEQLGRASAPTTNVIALPWKAPF